MANIGAAINPQSVKNVEQVVNISIKSGVPLEIEEIRIDTAGTSQVIEDHAITGREKRKNALPYGLVSSHSMSKDHNSVAPSFYTDIENI